MAILFHLHQQFLVTLHKLWLYSQKKKSTEGNILDITPQVDFGLHSQLHELCPYWKINMKEEQEVSYDLDAAFERVMIHSRGVIKHPCQTFIAWFVSKQVSRCTFNGTAYISVMKSDLLNNSVANANIHKFRGLF